MSEIYHSICLVCGPKGGKCLFPGRCFDASSRPKVTPRDPVDAALYVEDPDFDGVVPSGFENWEGIRDREWRQAQDDKIPPVRKG